MRNRTENNNKTERKKNHPHIQNIQTYTQTHTYLHIYSLTHSRKIDYEISIIKRTIFFCAKQTNMRIRNENLLLSRETDAI